MPTKYIARFNGKIVGKRTTENRKYTHAIVVQIDEAVMRKAAYEYEPTETDRKNFAYHQEIVACEGKMYEPNGRFVSQPMGNQETGGQMIQTWNTGKEYISSYGVEDIAESKLKTAFGFDGYVKLLRDEAIERFERNKAKGEYTPKVVTWCGRPDLARAAASERTNGKYYTGIYSLVQIVEAEVA